MKRFTKNILAIMLAVVMAMPTLFAMPEAAMAAEICPESAIAGPKTYNVDFWYINNQDGEKIPANYSNNIVYTNMDGTKIDDSERCVWTGQTQRDHLKMKFITPGVVVGVYDGVTKPSFPIVMETNWSEIAGNGEYLCFVQPYANSDATWNARKINFRFDWYGASSDSAWNKWPVGTNDSFKGEANAQISRSDGGLNVQNGSEQSNHLGKGGTKSGGQNNSGNNNNRYWRNSVEYYGSFSEGVYSDTITNADLLVGHVSRAKKAWIFGNDDWYYYSQKKAISNTFYVLNYKPLYDILKTSSPTTINVDGAKNIRELRDYLTTGDGSWKYTEASRNEALTRMAAVGNFDLNSYNFDYKSNTEAAVTTAAADIKTAYDNYKDIPNILVRQYKVTFKNYNNEEISHQYFATGTSASVVESAKPSLPAANYDENAHYSYAWESSCSNVTSDATYKQVRTATPHSYSGYVYSGNNEHTAICSVNSQNHSKTLPCDHNTAETPVAASGLHNGYTDYSCSVCGNTDVKDRVYNNLDWTAYNSALSDYTAKTTTNSALYTTSTVSECESYATGYTEYNSTANTGANTPQATLDTAVTRLSTAVGKLKVRASFDALDTAYTNAQNSFAALDEDDYTTSSYATVSIFLSDNAHFPYHFRTVEQKADTAADTNQSAIDTETGTLTNALSGLQLRADFSALDSAKGVWETYLITHAAEYTTTSKTALSDYINSTAEFPLENAADRADTGVSQNSAIAAEKTKYDNINPASYLDPLADLSEFDKAFDEADALLKSLAGKAAQYDADSVQALIDSVTTDKISTGTNIKAETIASANAATRADYGQAVESDADALAENIYDAINGLTLAAVDSQTSEPVDTSAFDSVVNTLNNLDPDAYEDVYDEELKDYVLESAQRIVNTAYGSETKEYDGETINVISGITSQEDADDAAFRIQSALTVCTKKYAITRTGVTSFGINNGTEEGGKVNYGATLTCKSGDADTAWFIEIETGSMHKKLAFQSYGSTLNTKVLGTTTVNAVKRDASNTCRVMVTRSYGAGDEREPIQYATFVPSGTVVELPAAPAIAFTTFNGYSYKDGAAISADGEGKYKITVTGDVDIVASYSENDASCAINATDISGGAHNSTVKYNEKVELDGGVGTYGWIEAVGDTYRPFYKGQKVSFLATESTTLIAVNETNFNKYGSLPRINLRKSGVIVTDSKYTFNAQLVPGSADVREYGILVAAPSSKNGYTPITPADSQIIIENSGQQQGYAVYRAKSTKLVGANQFSIAINNLPSGYKYRGYVIYHDGKSLQTVYTDVH